MATGAWRYSGGARRTLKKPGHQLQHHLADHLGSSSVVVNATGDWVNREEYFPYGETSFGGFSRKRYRFAGRERDDRTGLSHHEARWYSPRLHRWFSCDLRGPPTA